MVIETKFDLGQIVWMAEAKPALWSPPNWEPVYFEIDEIRFRDEGVLYCGSHYEDVPEDKLSSNRDVVLAECVKYNSENRGKMLSNMML